MKSVVDSSLRSLETQTVECSYYGSHKETVEHQSEVNIQHNPQNDTYVLVCNGRVLARMRVEGGALVADYVDTVVCIRQGKRVSDEEFERGWR